MEVERLFRLIFIVYYTTVGVLLLLIPWTPGWNLMLGHLPAALQLLKLPLVRGGVSGFGLVHLVWGAHDLYGLLLFSTPSHGTTHTKAAGDQ